MEYVTPNLLDAHSQHMVSLALILRSDCCCQTTLFLVLRISGHCDQDTTVHIKPPCPFLPLHTKQRIQPLTVAGYHGWEDFFHTPKLRVLVSFSSHPFVLGYSHGHTDNFFSTWPRLFGSLHPHLHILLQAAPSFHIHQQHLGLLSPRWYGKDDCRPTRRVTHHMMCTLFWQKNRCCHESAQVMCISPILY